MKLNVVENSNTRLTVMLDGLETHVYNRSNEYARLEKVFGIDEFMIPKTGKDSKSSPTLALCTVLLFSFRNRIFSVFREEPGGGGQTITPQTEPKTSTWNWRDLIPIIKLKISSVIFVVLKHLRVRI